MKTAADWLKLACPDCRRSLTEELVCNACQVVAGQYVDGIPCFTDPDYYWGEIPREDMQRINRLAKDLAWEAAVEQTVQNKSLREYICSPHRADFQYIWELPPGSTVLDVGAGLGAITSALGRNFSRVVAVEGVLERARFIQTRVRQLGQQGIQVVCADFLRLPLASDQFDVVVLNGVLEWAAISYDGDPRELQLRFLRRIRGLLKPTAFACVGIENRIGWAMLRGAVDHSGLRYTSLMPRKAASLWCRYKTRRYRSGINVGYRTYTYSLPGYRRLFRQAGFGRLRIFQAWDGYNRPSILLPVENSKALLRFLSRIYCPDTLLGKAKRLGLELAARSGLWAQLASDYIFLLDKADVSHPG